MTFAAKPQRPGFTLIELLIVISLATLLIALSLSGLQDSMLSQRLTGEALQLSATIQRARQYATRDNRPVILRLLNSTDPADPASPPAWRGWQLLQRLADGTPRALEEAHFMEAPLLMHADPAFTTLFGILPAQTAAPAQDPPLGTLGTAYSYVQATVHPDGSNNLPRDPANPLWSITLHLPTRTAKPGTPGPNYRTLLLDPFNTRVEVYD